MSERVDFLILAPLAEERDAILARLPAAVKLPAAPQDVRVYFQSEVPVVLEGDKKGAYRAVVTSPLGMGRVEAAIATADAIKRFSPRYILLVGIAGGEPSAVALGDVLVGEQFADYEQQKLTSGQPRVRYQVYRADTRLYGAAQVLRGWESAVTAPRPNASARSVPKPHFGVVMSGDKVQAKKDALKRYQRVWPKLIGVEMEAGGVAAAAWAASSKPGVLMVRGVSDLADANKGSARVEEFRPYACDVAAAYAIALLKSGPVPLLKSNSRGRKVNNHKFEVDRRAYADKLSRTYRIPRLEAMGVAISDYRDLDLAQLFVWQNAVPCEEPQEMELPNDHARRLTAFGHKLNDEEVAESASSDHDERRRQYFAQVHQNVLEIIDAPHHPRVVILGHPGSGKSSLLQALVLRWVQALEHDGRMDSLPILIELASYARSRSKGSAIQSLFDYCADSDQAPWHFEREDLRELLTSGQINLYFDGLDEIFDPELRNEVAQSITHLSEQYPQARIIVTSRIIGYKGETLSRANFAHFMLKELDEEQILEFITNWHRDTYSQTDELERQKKQARLVQAIQDVRPIRELASNPLLLTMMAILNRSEDLPHARVELYRRCAKLLLDRWKIGEAIRTDPVLREDRMAFGAEEKRELLRRVARYMKQGPQSIAGNQITGDALENVLAEGIRGSVRIPERQVAKALIQHLRERAHILCCPGDDTYAFVHRTFLEFFFADDLRRRFEQDKSPAKGQMSVEQLSEEQLIKLFSDHVRDETWQEVLSLLAGMLDATVVGRIVDALLALPDDGDVPYALFLAARCIGEVRFKDELSAACEQVRTRLDSLIDSDFLSHYYKVSEDDRWKYPGDVRGTALSLMIEVGADLQALRRRLMDLTQNDGDSRVRRASVSVLARNWKDDSDTLLWLKDLARNCADSYVACVSVQELARSWKNDPDTPRIIKDRAQYGESIAEREVSVQELARRWRGDPDVPRILRNLAQTDGYSPVRQVSIQELARGWKSDPETLRFLEDRLKREPDLGIRQVIVRELVYGWEGNQEVLRLLKDHAQDDISLDVRRECVRGIARGWRNASDTLAWLKDWSQNAFGAHGVSVQELARGWKNSTDVLRIVKDRAQNDGWWDGRLAGVQELARGWRNHPDTISILKNRAQNDECADVRRASVQELARGWIGDRDTFRFLKSCAQNDPDQDVRRTIVIELARGWKSDQDALLLLKDRAQNDEKGYVRAEGVNALAQILCIDPYTLHSLKECAQNDSDEKVRTAVLEALVQKWRNDVGTLPWLKDHAQNDLNLSVRLLAVSEIAHFWKHDPDTPDFIKNCAQQDDSYEVREASVEIISRGWKGAPDTLRWLKERAQTDAHWAVRATCVRAIARIWKNNQYTLPWLKHILQGDTDEQVRSVCVEEIGRGWKEDPDILRFLKEHAHSDKDIQVRRRSIECLAQSWSRDPSVLLFLKEIVRNDAEWFVRLCCMIEIAQSWPIDSDTLPLLRAIVRDDRERHMRAFFHHNRDIPRRWQYDPNIINYINDLIQDD